MNVFKQAFRNLLRRGQHNIAKILCLAVGIAVASVMIAEVYYEQTYNAWMPNADRVYTVTELITRDGEFKEWGGTSGAIAKGLEAYCPQIEAATRYTALVVGEFNTQYKQAFSEIIFAADSSFFDVLPRKILVGDIHKALTVPLACAVSQSFAEKVGWDKIIGCRLAYRDNPELTFQIEAVYEDFPFGSTEHTDGVNIVAAMPTMGWIAKKWGGFDGSQNWLGNDRYTSLVRLKSGTKPEQLTPMVKKMMADNIDTKALRDAGQGLMYGFKLYSASYSDDPYVKKVCWILSLLAAVLLFSTVMNYLLIVVGNIIQRSREMAVRKCFGAQRLTILKTTVAETLVHLVVAVVIALALLFSCKGTIQEFLSAPLDILLFSRGAWIFGLIGVLIVAIGGIVPAWMYNRTPVTAAFRGFHTSRRRWKLGLLAIQFVASALLVSLLVVIHLQYTMMLAEKTGYEYDRLAVVSVNGGVHDKNYRNIFPSLRQMSEVEAFTTATCLPLESLSGNNISIPNDDRELNIADLYSVGDDFTAVMGMKIIAGKSFTEHSDSLHEILVSRRFVTKMDTMYHWKGNIVGRQIYCSEHSQTENDLFTIVGVYDDIHVGSLKNTEERATVMFYAPNARNSRILVKLHALDEVSIAKLRDCIEKSCPGRDVTVSTYPELMKQQYANVNSLRNGIMVAGVSAFIIALVGLVGYTVDEVNRRRKEIAIRKVNGARLVDILRLLVRSIVWLALPSLAVGAVLAYWIGGQWTMLFSERIALSPLIFIATVAVLLALAVGMVVANSYKVANSNPVDYLKDE